MEYKKAAYENLAESLIEKFNLRGIESYYVDNRAEALDMVKRLLTPGSSVAWGGSQTLSQIGLLDYLKESDFQLYDRHAASTPEEKKEITAKAFTADFYLMSSNAITLNGELVNIDGNGNRVACLIYGPENVIIVAGMNKVCADVDSAIKRIRNVASPANTVRLGAKTPCAEIGRCGDCLCPDTICCQIVITRKSRVPNRIKVILVGEELGY